MVRVKRGFVARRKHKKLLKRAKGFTGSLRRLYRQAKQTVYHAMRYSTYDRRDKKANFRRLWISRIGAAARSLGLSYNKFINGLKKKKILLDRKMLAHLAVNEPNAFKKLVELIKG